MGNIKGLGVQTVACSNICQEGEEGTRRRKINFSLKPAVNVYSRVRLSRGCRKMHLGQQTFLEKSAAAKVKVAGKCSLRLEQRKAGESSAGSKLARV